MFECFNFVGLDDYEEALPAHSDSDVFSESSFTISTPSDEELENMSPVGTLRSDGTLAPSAGQHTTPSVSANQSKDDEDDLFFTPMVKTPNQSNKVIASNQPIKSKPAQQPIKVQFPQKKPIRRSGRSGKMGKAGVGNPTYDQVVRTDDCITGTPKRRLDPPDTEEESIYLTPELPGNANTFTGYLLQISSCRNQFKAASVISLLQL